MEIVELKNVCRNYKVAKRDRSFLHFMLRRKFEIIEAVKNVSFSISSGELVGFIGPNGAGKSTTIKMMTGILVPTSGELRLFDNAPHKNRKRNAINIGVVFGQRSQLWWDLPVVDTYKLLKKIYRIPDDVFAENLKSFGSVLGIEEFYNQPVRQCSLGQKMRADLCASLLHNPKILFLDEPTIGLDISVKKQIREMIKRIRDERGVTVVLTTHDMKDIEEICERIILIDEGRILLDMPVAEVKDTFRGNSSLVIEFDKAPEGLAIDNVKIEKLNDLKYILAFDAKKISAGKLLTSITREYDVLDIAVNEPGIEDIIHNLYSAGEIREIKGAAENDD
jgi:ABC-2 type transport system ATP-binding protein